MYVDDEAERFGITAQGGRVVRIRLGGRHDIWALGELELPIPRHREINEYTARAILKATERRKQ